MPKIITANSVSEMNLKAFELILHSGKKTTNRNKDSLGDIFVEYDVNCVLTNIRNRHLNLKGRNSNIFALIGESMWVMAGREDTEYLMNFIPRANDFSDDGKTWRASYGERMYHQDQLQGIIEIFKEDGLYTRRATLTIYDPNKDTKKALKEVYGLDKSLDIPCNQWLNFFVDFDNSLNLKVIQRSGDAIWGAMSINLVEFSILHEIVYNTLKWIYPEIKLGTYNHSITNFHIYENTSSQAREALNIEQPTFLENQYEIDSPENIYDLKEFFKIITEIIESRSSSFDDIVCLFEDFELSIENNILLYYVYFSKLYLDLRQEGFKGNNKLQIIHPKIIEEFLNIESEYSKAIAESKFRNFTIPGELI